MIAIMLMMMQASSMAEGAAGGAAQTAVAQLAPMLPPADWTALPVLPVIAAPDAATDPAAYVRREVMAGRCRAQPDAPGRWMLTVKLSVLIGPNGAPRQITPAAIGCPTIEQYTVGYVSTLVRRSTADPIRPGWYRLPITYRW